MERSVAGAYPTPVECVCPCVPAPRSGVGPFSWRDRSCRRRIARLCWWRRAALRSARPRRPEGHQHQRCNAPRELRGRSRVDQRLHGRRWQRRGRHLFFVPASEPHPGPGCEPGLSLPGQSGLGDHLSPHRLGPWRHRTRFFRKRLRHQRGYRLAARVLELVAFVLQRRVPLPERQQPRRPARDVQQREPRRSADPLRHHHARRDLLDARRCFGRWRPHRYRAV